MRRVLGLSAGAAVSGVAAALCCAGPLLAPGASCASGTQRRWACRLLILGTTVTILAASYPFWSVWF
jgi:hypothetical protein